MKPLEYDTKFSKKGMWYFEIIDTKTNTIVGSQETFSKAKKTLNKIIKEAA